MARLKALTDSLKSVVWEGRVPFTEADLLAEVNNTPVDVQKILEHVFGPDGLDRDPLVPYLLRVLPTEPTQQPSPFLPPASSRSTAPPRRSG